MGLGGAALTGRLAVLEILIRLREPSWSPSLPDIIVPWNGGSSSRSGEGEGLEAQVARTRSHGREGRRRSGGGGGVVVGGHMRKKGRDCDWETRLPEIIQPWARNFRQRARDDDDDDDGRWQRRW